jgi:osmoprotectant transport system ATP-binding protein
VVQFDTPETILTHPVNDFVRDFIGSGASLKRLNLSRVRDIELSHWPTVPEGTSAEDALQVLRSAPGSAVLVLDAQGRPRRWVGATDLQRADRRPLDQIGMHPEAIVEPHATLSDALNELITARYSIATVVDGNGVYQGVVDIDRITEAIRTMRSANQVTARRDLDGTPDAARSN